MNQFLRTELLLGGDAMKRLASCRVAVFGLGGVGGYAAEALARTGIGALDLTDRDSFSETNLNRQLHATCRTIGRLKTEVVKERILEINPDCRVETYPVFFLPETRNRFNFSRYDYVVDAIDTVSGKMALAEAAQDAGVPVISAMGAGNKLDPTAFRVADIYETSVCPLARIMRRECRRRGIRQLKTVFSTEPPVNAAEDPDSTGREAPEPDPGRRDVPGSCAFVTSVAGMILAAEVVRDLCGLPSLCRKA